MDSESQDTQRQELRQWLANRLKWEEIPEPLWKVLGMDADAVLDPNDPLDQDEFLGLARERIRFATDMAPYVSPDAPYPGNVVVNAETLSQVNGHCVIDVEDCQASVVALDAVVSASLRQEPPCVPNPSHPQPYALYDPPPPF